MAKETKVLAQINLSCTKGTTTVYIEGLTENIALLLTKAALQVPFFEEALDLAQLQIREAKDAQG